MSNKRKNNNSNNNNNNNAEDIDNRDLKKHKKDNSVTSDTSSSIPIKQLLKLASSLGISVGKKENAKVIEEKIKNVTAITQGLVCQQENAKNVNSFNKGIIELKFKDGLGVIEILFWKVFRNKVIYKTIMANMYNKSIYSFDNMFSVQNMITNNQLQLLRCKVLRKEYLSFSFPSHTLPLIFQLIKNSNDKEFYVVLFTHYRMNILEFYSNKLTKLANSIIEKDCMVALMALREIEIGQLHRFSPTNSNLERAILNGSLNTIEYMLNNGGNLRVNFNIFFEFKYYNASQLKSLKYLYENSYINVNNGLKLISKLYCLNLRPYKSRYNKKQLFQSNIIINETTTIQDLITIIKIILLIYQTGNTLTPFSNYEYNLNEISYYENLLKSSEQLQSELWDIKLQEEPFRTFIMALLDIYYHHSKSIKVSLLFYFGNNITKSIFKNQIGLTPDIMIDNIFCAFKCCNILLFNWIVEEKYDFYIPRVLWAINCDYSRKNNPTPLFSHCQDNNTRIDFLIIITRFYAYSREISEVIIKLAIASSDLELVQLIFSLPVLDTHQPLLDSSISKFIKSESVLKWVFSNYPELFDELSWLSFKDNLVLIKCYQGIYSKNLKFGGFKKKFYAHSYSKQTIDFILQSYNFDKTDYQIYGLIFTMDNKFNSFKLEMAKNVYFKTENGEITKSKESINYKNLSRINKLHVNTRNVDLFKFLDWLVEEFNYQIQYGGHFFSGKKNQISLYKVLNKYNLLELQSIIRGPIPYEFEFVLNAVKLIEKQLSSSSSATALSSSSEPTSSLSPLTPEQQKEQKEKQLLLPPSSSSATALSSSSVPTSSISPLTPEQQKEQKEKHEKFIEDCKNYLLRLLYLIGIRGDKKSFLYIFQFHSYFLQAKNQKNDSSFTFEQLKKILKISLDYQNLDFAQLLLNFFHLSNHDLKKYNKVSLTKSFLLKYHNNK